MTKTFVWSALASLLLGAVACADFAVNAGGKPGAFIVVSDEGSAVQAYAAQELQRALLEVTGVSLPIVGGEKAGGGPRLLIGRAENLQKELGGCAVTDKEVLVKVVGETVCLTGEGDREALYATYVFLERCAGVRWLWPGKEGEFYPRNEGLTIGEQEIREKPSLQFRSVALNAPHYDEDTLVWKARQRMNIGGVRPGRPETIVWLQEKGFLTRMAGHNVTLPAKLLQEHPDWIAEYAGQRVPPPSDDAHLCWSNAGVQEALKEKVADWVKTNPGLDMVSLYTADHNRFCECVKCIEMAPDVSTRWQKLSKLLIASVKGAVPEMLVSTLAYQAYRSVPTEMAPYDLVGYATYNISYRYPFSEPHKGNAAALEEIRQWQALGAKMGLRGYEMIVATGPRAFLPLVYLLKEDISYATKMGLTHFSSEVAPYGYPKKVPAAEQGWNVNRLNLYAMARLMWNADLSVDEILEDWCSHAYGPAADEMKAYYFGMEKAWRGAAGDVSYFLNPSPTLARHFMSDELVGESERLLSQAAGKVAESPRLAKVVDLDREMFKTWKRLNSYRNASLLRSEVAALKVAQPEEMRNLPWDKARVFPHFVGPEGETPKEATEVRALWDEEHLYLQVVCCDSEPERRVASRRAHDDKVWSEDALEFFINNAEGGYGHLALNSLGTRYDARSVGGMSLDLGFSPEWRAEVEADGDRWTAFIALPFSWVQRNAEGAVVMSIKRSAPGRERSGWPEASYHNPSGAGTISLVEQLKPQVLLYDGGRDGAPLFAALRRKGWNVARVEQVEKEAGRLSLDGADIVSLFYGSGTGFNLSRAFFRDEVRPFVESGGVVILGGSNAMPVDEWFDDPELALKWSGWEIARPRLSEDVREGKWLVQPNDLRKLFSTATTPSSSYAPRGEGWTPLASLLMRNGATVPYLLACRLGKGLLIVTSSNWGYGGGYEIFGHRNSENIVKLMENIYSHHETLL